MMTNEEFLLEIEILLYRVIDTKSDKLLLECQDFDFFVSPSIASRYITNHRLELEPLALTKLAFIPPTN